MTGKRAPLQDPPSLKCRLWLSLTTITPRCGVWAGTSPAPYWPPPGMMAVCASGKVGGFISCCCWLLICFPFILVLWANKAVFCKLCLKRQFSQRWVNSDSHQALTDFGWCIVGISQFKNDELGIPLSQTELKYLHSDKIHSHQCLKMLSPFPVSLFFNWFWVVIQVINVSTVGRKSKWTIWNCLY